MVARPAQISFAGHPVLLDVDDKVVRWMTRYGASLERVFMSYGDNLAAQSSRMQEFLGQYIDWFALPYDKLPTPRISELIWPTGISRCARGLFLIDWATLRDIVYKCSMGSELPEDPTAEDWTAPGNGSASEEFLWKPIGDTPAEDPEDEIVTNELAVQMFPLAPIRIDHSPAANLWLLPLVDRRWEDARKLWTPTVTKDTTWDEFLDQFETESGAVIQRDGLSASYSPAMEVYGTGLPIPMSASVDAAILGAAAYSWFSPELGEFETIDGAGARINEDWLTDIRGDDDDPDFITSSKNGANGSPQLIRLSPIYRRYANGRGGSMLDTISGQSALSTGQVRYRCPTSLMLDGSGTPGNPFGNSVSLPYGHHATWIGRLPENWDKLRSVDYLIFSGADNRYQFESVGLRRDFVPRTIPLQYPGTRFHHRPFARVRLTQALSAGGTANADFDEWKVAQTNWEPTGINLAVREGLNHIASPLPIGSTLYVEHAGDAGWLVRAGGC